MSSLSDARKSNEAFFQSLSTIPTGVFVGGTAGIGMGVAQSFAQLTKGNANILIVGRNKQAAQDIIATFPKPSLPNIRHEFVQCDASRLSEVRSASSKIRDILSPQGGKINFLVLTTGFFSANGREETEDGLDKKLAVAYYSRWKFIDELVPGLVKAAEAKEPAKVVTVLNPNLGAPLDTDDLGLKKNYGLLRYAKQGATYNTLMCEGFASRYPSISFIHSFPGTVKTDILGSAQTSWIRWLAPVYNFIGPYLLSAMSPQECGDWTIHGALQSKPGASTMDQRGKRYEVKTGAAEDVQALWEHTVEETKSK